MKYVRISVKIPRKLKELMDQYGIKPSCVIKEALEEKVREIILEELEKRAEELKEELKGISDEKIAELIREDREG